MPNDALTLKYSPRGGAREYNTFTEEYFSGADVTVYLGSEKMAQVTSLQYSVQEQLKPMYGYASRTFDDVAIGNRIVIGSFRVPVSNPEPNMNVNLPVAVQPTDDGQDNIEPTLPSWTVNNVRYGNIEYVNQGREYTDSEQTGHGNATVPTHTSPIPPKLSPLKYSEETLRLQRRLLELSYNVDVTGIYDLKTKKAVKAFQESCHINDTGDVDKETLGYLYGDAEAGITYGFTTADHVTLRLGPGSGYKPISSQLPIHTKIQIIEEEGDWYKIKLDDNKKGFVAKTFIKVL